MIALVGAGCIKLADFHPGGGSGSGTPDARTADAANPGECGNGMPGQATASMSGSAICAAGPGYVLRFPGSSFHYPDQLRIGTADVLGTSSACNEESLIGEDAYPMKRFSSDSTATGETASATIILPGPTVAKVAVNWSLPLMSPCASSGMVSGHSTFTLFPDGRLVRYDELTTPALASQTNCDCDSAAQLFLLTAYITFEPNITITKQTGETIFPSTGEGMAMPQLVCVSDNGWRIAIVEQLVGRARNATGGGIALTTDLDNTGAMSLSAGTRGGITAYKIGTDTCVNLLAPIAQYMNATGPQLHVHSANGFDDTIGTERDGMYGGDNGTGNGLPTGGPGTLTLTTADTIPPGWALWVSGLTLGQPSATPARTGNWFAIQNVAGDAIIWFRDGLAAGQTITVPAS
ncbi:MAG: hypothetical protein JO257_25400 [Deltaproteobacteria bacterium]|nr:hypothetical protein [Deltaproteobacteria bacterium]